MQRALLLLCCALAACDHSANPDLDDLRLVLLPSSGTGELEHKISAAQDDVRAGRAVAENLDKLGRLFIAKARVTTDPGFYKLAEQCADGIERRVKGHTGGRLLRGHVLHSLHRFAAAEAVARALVLDRKDFTAHGLLGDVLYDKGQVREALEQYQRMLDLKPCLQSYARAGQVRWLRGDYDSSRQLLRMAVGAGSRRDPEALCWAYARLAALELGAGDLTACAQACAQALAVDGNSVPALLVDARLLAARGQVAQALAQGRRAAELCPLPEHRWLVADLARQLGDATLVNATEASLHQTGAQDDPRHYALFLLARGGQSAVALQLAERELSERQDVFTHDLHAFALLHAGKVEAAHTAMQKALALGTDDARLHYHAGAIARARKDRDAARAHFAAAQAREQTLWPSERADLRARSSDVAAR
jgi:tetratricopeptide (TPR) repeat protein